ncbi:hypothetical protein KDM89_06855 [Undibacterium sp. LFS511W]|uniref:Peptidase M61 catalytic domain-containing protein n=2 Tax=Undibacterium luofuense TaxID=2828733 RepID=A0A941I7H9_9BURK|nr:hypothetical protein [Undibacterium luofuense]
MLILLYTFASTALAQSALVTLAFNADHSSVEASFELSHAVEVLRFAGNGEIRLRSWVPQGGVRLNADGTALLLPKPQKRFSVRLNAFEYDGLLDRVYTPVILFGDGRGAQVYSEYLLPKGGGAVNLANAGVVLGRAVSKGMIVWRANDPSTYIVIGQVNTKAEAAYVITIDNALPSWIAKSLDKRVGSLMDLYSRKFGISPKHKPWIVVSYDPVAATGEFGFRGDTNPGMVRLNLMGQSWKHEDVDQAYQLDNFVAHELFHLWNAELWHLKNNEPVWLLEGGAEAASHDALRTLGLADTERYRYQRANTLIGCTTANGETLSSKLVSGGRTHYNCGASIFYLAAAMSEDSSLPITPLDLWADLFAATKTSRSYTVADLLRVAMQRASHSSVSTQQSYLNDLIESKLPWREVLARGQQIFHIHQITAGEHLPAIVAKIILDKLVIDRVAYDCDGATSVAYDNQIYQVDALDSCHRIRRPVILTHLGGYSMRENGLMAVAYARNQCSKGLDLHFGGKEDVSLDIPCSQMPPMPSSLFVPDFDH